VAAGGGVIAREEMAACIAYVMAWDAADVPVSTTTDPLSGWRGWLAGRGLGLVPIAEPGRFAWAGTWIATGARPGGAPGAAVMFGVPPGVLFDPLGDGAAPPAIEAGFAVAALDVSRRGAEETGDVAPAGVVEGIFVAAAAEAPMTAVGRVAATTAGLEGDRYVRGAGTFSNRESTGGALTLIEAETVEALGLAPGEARRNVVTRGLGLNALVGRRFRVGDVECYGQRLCEPCAHLQRLTRPGILRALVHRGGLRADVVTDGVIEVGAPVVAA
jgi:hypothetical protein